MPKYMVNVDAKLHAGVPPSGYEDKKIYVELADGSTYEVANKVTAVAGIPYLDGRPAKDAPFWIEYTATSFEPTTASYPEPGGSFTKDEIKASGLSGDYAVIFRSTEYLINTDTEAVRIVEDPIGDETGCLSEEAIALLNTLSAATTGIVNSTSSEKLSDQLRIDEAKAQLAKFESQLRDAENGLLEDVVDGGIAFGLAFAAGMAKGIATSTAVTFLPAVGFTVATVGGISLGVAGLATYLSKEKTTFKEDVSAASTAFSEFANIYKDIEAAGSKIVEKFGSIVSKINSGVIVKDIALGIYEVYELRQAVEEMEAKVNELSAKSAELSPMVNKIRSDIYASTDCEESLSSVGTGDGIGVFATISNALRGFEAALNGDIGLPTAGPNIADLQLPEALNAGLLVTPPEQSEYFDTGGDRNVSMTSPLDKYNINLTSASVTVDKNPGATFVKSEDGFKILWGVDRIGFQDGTFALDVGEGQNAGSAYRLYQAAFSREPDIGGLKNWVTHVDQGMSLEDAAGHFINSSEFSDKYGSDLSNSEFVDQLYLNVLGRPAEAEGRTAWLNALDSGHQSRNTVLASFSESVENITNVEPSIMDGIWLG